jgi:hypothetical protein
VTDDRTTKVEPPAQVEIVMMNVEPAALRLAKRSRRITVTVLTMPGKPKLQH